MDTPAKLPDYIARAYPYPGKMADVEWGEMHFTETGKGRPVLLIHGNPTWGYLYRKVMKVLEGKPLRLIAPDLIGLGLSHKPRSLAEHTLRHHGESMLRFVEKLDLKDIILVVQDWGGPIGGWMAAHVPERVTGLVLMNTSLLKPNRFKTTAFHRFAQLPFISDFAFRGLQFPVRYMNRVQGDPKSLSAPEKAAYLWPMRNPLDRAAPLALARMVPNGENHPSVAELARCDAWARSFKGPVEIVWGKKDPILGRLLKRHQEAFPQNHTVETEAGHFLQEEVPELIAGAILKVAGL